MKVYWTDFAWNMLSQAADYVLIEFGFKTYDGFMQDVNTAVFCIMANPKSGVIEPYLQGKVQEYRSLVVNKRCKLVYEVHESEDTIYIVDFWDTKRNPELLKASH